MIEEFLKAIGYTDDLSGIMVSYSTGDRRWIKRPEAVGVLKRMSAGIPEESPSQALDQSNLEDVEPPPEDDPMSGGVETRPGAWTT